METKVTNIDGIEKVFNTDAELIEYTQLIFDENEEATEPEDMPQRPETVEQCLQYIATYSEHELETDVVDEKTLERMKSLYKAEVAAGIYNPLNPTQSLNEKLIEAKKLK